MEHFKKAIGYFQSARDPIQTANTQLNAAQLLDMLSRTKEAKEYAREAVEIYENVGHSGEELSRAQRMLAKPDS